VGLRLSGQDPKLGVKKRNNNMFKKIAGVAFALFLLAGVSLGPLSSMGGIKASAKTKAKVYYIVLAEYTHLKRVKAAKWTSLAKVRKKAAKYVRDITDAAKKLHDSETQSFGFELCDWSQQTCIDKYIDKVYSDAASFGTLEEKNSSFDNYYVPLATAYMNMKYVTCSGSQNTGFRKVEGTVKNRQMKKSSVVVKIDQQTFDAKMYGVQLSGTAKKVNLMGLLEFDSGTQYYNFQKVLSTLPSGSKIVYQGKTPKLETKGTEQAGKARSSKKWFNWNTREKIGGLKKLSNKKFKVTQTVKG
jgi:hypothetical protein